MSTTDVLQRGLVRRARALVRLLRGAPPRQAPSGRVYLQGLTAPLEEGALDGVVDGVAQGWARRKGAPQQPVCVDLYVDGRFVGRTQADRYRPDLAAGGGRGMYGFSHVLPLSTRAGRELRAFAATSGTELGGSPRSLTAPAAAPLGARAERQLLKLDFSAGRALTLAEQKAHYGRRFDILTEADPGFGESAWPVSRCMGYVDAIKLVGRSSVGGGSRFFRLFDAAAEHFSATPFGMPVGQDLMAMLTAPALASGGPPTRLLELVIEAQGGRASPLLASADYAGIGLDYLYSRRLPLDLLGEPLRRELQGPAKRREALRRMPALREAAGSDDALAVAAEAIGLVAALHSSGEHPGHAGAETVQTGVRVISADYGDTGLGLNLRRTLEALERLGIVHEHSAVKMRALSSDRPAPERLLDTVLIHAQPVDAVELILRLPAAQAARRLIGFFMWETESAPPEFDLGLHLVDEVWTGSHFSADALSSRLTSPNVHVVGHAVEAEAVDETFDAHGLADATASDFLVYTHFDAGSWITRKNPMAVAYAFRRAFPRGDEPCRLLIKTRGGEAGSDAVQAAWDDLREAMALDPRIRLVETNLARSGAAALMATADCYVSLHRAEGFGYGPAEAMLAGIPLVVSAYSGTLDFTRDAWLVPCRRRPIRPGEFLSQGAGQYWGEPQVEVAAAHLAAIFNDLPAAKARAQAARAWVASRLSVEALAGRYGERLQAV